MAGFCLWHGAQNRAYAETSVLKAPAAEKTHSQYWALNSHSLQFERMTALAQEQNLSR
jgi:hypothetical protein